MRYLKLIIALSLVAGLIVAAGCSGNSTISPDINPDRLAVGNGPDNCPGPNGPNGPNGPWHDFEVDCVRYFDVDYDMTAPSGMELEATGQVIIYDADCSALESEIRVKLFVQTEYMDEPKRLRILPGIRSLTDGGTLYSWEFTKEHSGNHHSFEFSIEYQLLVKDWMDNHPIDGSVHRHKYHWWTLPNGKEKEKEWNWDIDIEGVEVFPDD